MSLFAIFFVVNNELLLGEEDCNICTRDGK